MFAGGYFFRDLLAKEQLKNVKITPTPTHSKTTSLPTEYLPYNLYFDDSLIMVAKDAPHEVVIVSASRNEMVKKIVQTTRMSYFNGEKWDRKVAYGIAGNAGIVSDSIIKKWSVEIDSSRLLKQSSKGELKFGTTNITFSTGELLNEMGIRSLPGYTKFLSVGEGSFNIDGKMKPAYILYERIYSLNDSEIQFYNTPLGVTTYWMAFWDEGGNFYHLDRSDVARPTRVYESHKLGVIKTSNGSVTKTFDVVGSRNHETNPTTFNFQLNNPVNTQINTTVTSFLDKATAQEVIWRMNSVTGTVKKDGKDIKGIGLVEIVKDN
jgi:hypothetical protein